MRLIQGKYSMKYYVPIEINNLKIIQDKLYDLFPKSYLVTKSTKLIYSNEYTSFQDLPELKTEIDRLGLADSVFECGFLVLHKSEIELHTDPGSYIYSFNIPVLNCDNTFVNFYKTTSIPAKKILPSGVRYDIFETSQATLVDSLELTTPHIINTKKPHAIVNPNNTPRITFLIRLKRELNLDHLFGG